MIELSSEARRAYEVMLSSLERSDQPDTEQQGNTEPLQINSLAEESEPGPDSKHSEKPYYCKSQRFIYSTSMRGKPSFSLTDQYDKTRGVTGYIYLSNLLENVYF